MRLFCDNKGFELLWMKIVFDDLRIKYDTPMRLFCDNKHIEIDRHIIKEKLDNGLVKTVYVPSKHQCRRVD